MASRRLVAGLGLAFAQERRGEALGACVVSVVPGSPADRHGVRISDRLLAVDGHPISSFQDAARWIPGQEGSRTTLKLQRQGPKAAAPRARGLHTIGCIRHRQRHIHRHRSPISPHLSCINAVVSVGYERLLVMHISAHLLQLRLNHIASHGVQAIGNSMEPKAEDLRSMRSQLRGRPCR